jgi:hypothetical protein
VLRFDGRKRGKAAEYLHLWMAWADLRVLGELGGFLLLFHPGINLGENRIAFEKGVSYNK